MASPSNLVLQLLITAKDSASAVFGNLFGFLDRTTSATANLIREKFTDLFGGGLEGAIEFEAQLDKVQAKGGYTADVMATLKKSAEDIGAQFGISGTEAAQGMESLAAAGLNAEQVIQTLPTVLSLAKAEALSFDAASALVANSLTTVGLGFDQAARLADVLTQAANESTTSASAVGKALETAGGIARASALDLEQTVAALTALAKGGIEGERAGTSLAAILTQLLNPASAASKALDALGITSRDLGTVIGELESRGAGANTAILAFGETAGPGLRALIGQGQDALTELETSMRGAGGAADNAATQMGGNLKTALSSLESAWESVKTALLEPVLEPLAKAANDASTALNTNLREGALKPVQEAIKAFVENSIQFARDFIASFDFKDVAASLQSLASNAASAFTSIGDYGSKAADVVQIAWNGVTGTVRAISAVMVEVTASAVATLANVEEAASKVGLGSVQRANELRQKALEMQETARGLAASVQQDVADLAGAYDRLTIGSDRAAEAQQNLKAALPAAELQTLTKTLDDYRGMAERANAQAAQSAKDLAAGAISAQQYGEKLLAAAEANRELADATERQAQQTRQAAAATNEQARALGLIQFEKAAQQAQSHTAALEDLVDAETASIRAEIALAEAKGDTAQAQDLTQKLARQEAEGAVRVARAKQAEQEAEVALAVAKRNQIETLVAKNQATQEDLALAELVVQKELAEAQTAGIHAQALEVLAQKLATINQLQQGGTDTTRQNTQAIENNAEANEQNAESVENASKSYTRMESAAAGALRELTALSAGMNTLISNMLRMDDVGQYFGNNFRGELGKLQLQLEWTNYAIEETSKTVTVAADAYEQQVLVANAARKMYLDQAIAATELAGALTDATEATNTSRAALEDMVNTAGRALQGMDLLDDQTLERLQSAIDAATDKLQEMQEATEDARARLAELNAEILEEQGQNQKAELLRQQLDYQEQLAELERQRQDAELTGNRELLNILEEQEQKLRVLNDLRIQNINADADSRTATDRTTSSVSRLADEAERAGRALSAVSAADLSRLSIQSETLRRNFSDLSDLL